VTLLPTKSVRVAGTWIHTALHAGDTVDVQACTNVPGNTGTACTATTFTVT
jgi:hypothetical protein